MLVVFDGCMVSLPASFTPFTKIAEDGTATANAMTSAATEFGWKAQARFGTGNQIQRIMLMIMRNSYKPASHRHQAKDTEIYQEEGADMKREEIQLGYRHEITVRKSPSAF